MGIAVRPGGPAAPVRTTLVGHNHDGRYALAGGGGTGGTGADVALTGTEGVTVVEAPANTFALGLTASAAANNAVEIRADGVYALAGLTQAAADLRYEPIDTMYTKSESDAKYALATALTAALARITTLEAQVATLNTRMAGHTHLSGTIAAAGGTAVLP